MNFRLTTKVCLLLLAIALLVNVASAAPTKYDFLNVTRQECGITSCTTYYTVTNPTASTITVTNAQLLKVAGKTDFLGTDLGFTTEILNVSNQWQDVTTITSITSTTGQKVYFRVRGSFIPVYPTKDKVTYAIDHYPSFYGNIYPEYDLWNQTWNKCMNVNITHNLGVNQNINETFPQRILLNASNMNISAIRSDWGDVRFGKGTCANVTADYYHNFVWKNTTNAEAIIYLNPMDVVNNTAAQVAIYYNNTAAKHIEPSETAINWGGGGFDLLQKVMLFTFDKTTDTQNNVGSATNDTYTLANITVNSIVTGSKWGNAYRLSNSGAAAYAPISVGDTNLVDGYTTMFLFSMNSTNTTGTQYLFSMGNATDNTKTKVAEAFITTTVSGGASQSFTDDSGISGYTEASANQCNEMSITNLDTTQKNITGVQAVTSATWTRCFLYNNTVEPDAGGSCTVTGGVLLAQGTASSGNCTFTNGGYNLQAGKNVTILVDAAGSSWNVQYKASALPVTGSTGIIKWHCGGSDGSPSCDGYARSVQKVYFNNGTSSGGSASQTLNVSVYYYNGFYSKTFSLGTLLPNTQYGFGLTATKTNSTNLRTIVFFNNTLLDVTNQTKAGGNPAGGSPFRQDVGSNCTVATGNTCLKNYVYGANGIVNASGDVIGATQSLNGTIDEIISSYIATGDVPKAGNTLMYGWLSSTPTWAYSGTYISNLFPPNITLSVIPASPVYSDDLLGHVDITDGDSTTDTITIQWRVNGTLVRTTSGTASSGSYFSDALAKGNYSKGSVVNVTAWANDSLYTTANQSIVVTIGGVRPNPTTGLACSTLNKTAVNCSWVNPTGNVSYSMVLLNSSNIANVTNTTTAITITGLFPDNSYGVSIVPVSADGAQAQFPQSVTVNTQHNVPPNITSYTPTNTTPTFAEGTTQTFTVTVTDDDANPIIAWFKDNVFQVFGNMFTWAIGKNDQGTHNITATVNDTWGATTSQTWIATVTDDYPAPNTPTFNPNGGLFRTMIPVKCASSNSYSAVDHYDITVSVNGGAYQNLSMGNKIGFVQYDITQYAYYTNLTFNCSAVGESGNSSSVSNKFTRDYINEFYATTTQSSLDFSTMTPYTFSLYYDGQNPSKNITVKYAYADCNGDGLYDYVYNYTGIMPSRVKQRFVCVFPAGNVPFEIGVFLSKNTADTWAGTGCSTDYDYSNTCLVKKKYILGVSQ